MSAPSATGAGPVGRPFVILWSGQAVSLLGSGLTEFAVGLWLYQQTGSVSLFAMVAVLAYLPALVVSPMAGLLADRRSKRRIMALADGMAALATLALAGLLAADALTPGGLYAIVAVGAVARAFQWAAFTAIIPAMVGPLGLARAHGLVQAARAGALVGAPLLAALLLDAVGLAGIVLLDFLSVLVALVTLALAAPPHATTQAPAENAGALALLPQLWRRRDMRHLLWLGAGAHLAFGLMEVLVTPYVLAFATVTGLGLALTAGGLGWLAGAVLLGAVGGRMPAWTAIALGFAVQALALVGGALVPTLPAAVAAISLFLFAFPVITGAGNALWQARTGADLQGRMAAARQMADWGALVVAYLIAGPIGDATMDLLNPPAGAVTGLLAQGLGSGPGRGLAIPLLVLATLLGLAALVTVAARHSFTRRARQPEDSRRARQPEDSRRARQPEDSRRARQPEDSRRARQPGDSSLRARQPGDN